MSFITFCLPIVCVLAATRDGTLVETGVSPGQVLVVEYDAAEHYPGVPAAVRRLAERASGSGAGDGKTIRVSLEGMFRTHRRIVADQSGVRLERQLVSHDGRSAQELKEAGQPCFYPLREVYVTLVNGVLEHFATGLLDDQTGQGIVSDEPLPPPEDARLDVFLGLRAFRSGTAFTPEERKTIKRTAGPDAGKHTCEYVDERGGRNVWVFDENQSDLPIEYAYVAGASGEKVYTASVTESVVRSGRRVPKVVEWRGTRAFPGSDQVERHTYTITAFKFGPLDAQNERNPDSHVRIRWSKGSVVRVLEESRARQVKIDRDGTVVYHQLDGE